MTFKEALERELTAQGLAVAEISKKSGVSRGAIYNILNGTTEDDRVRPSTRRALAEACGRTLRVGEEGSVTFAAPDAPGHAPVSEHPARITLAAGRPFYEHQHIRDGFDWLYEREEAGDLTGIEVVDRVFQKRSDFLSLVVEPSPGDEVVSLACDMTVAYEEGPGVQLPVTLSAISQANNRIEATLFVSAGPSYSLKLDNVTTTNDVGEVSSHSESIVFTHSEEAAGD